MNIYNPVSCIIRFVLAFVLIYGVYTETGIWTGISLLLITLGVEAHGFVHHIQDKKVVEEIEGWKGVDDYLQGLQGLRNRSKVIDNEVKGDI